MQRHDYILISNTKMILLSFDNS